ncbi:MAG: flavodoxin reductase [Roseibium sp.]|nr:flavodoxin reductase [Roseibium sp.]
MTRKVKILSKNKVTHNVWSFRTERPNGYSFEPGQATELRIDRPDWEDEARPFTFTSLPEDNHLEFTIKAYRDHDGVTHKFDDVVPGERFIIEDAWGAIGYKGRGTFIAGGAGLTPFLAILRDLEAKGELSGHRLLFGNKTAADIILKEELDGMTGLKVDYALSEENCDGMRHGQFDKAALAEIIRTIDQTFYVCGPEKMVEAMVSNLKDMGVDDKRIVTEE